MEEVVFSDAVISLAKEDAGPWGRASLSVVATIRRMHTNFVRATAPDMMIKLQAAKATQANVNAL